MDFTEVCSQLVVERSGNVAEITCDFGSTMLRSVTMTDFRKSANQQISTLAHGFHRSKFVAGG
jgi:hypothetical protein